VLQSPTIAEFLTGRSRPPPPRPPTRQNDRVTATRILVVEDSNAIRLPVVTALSAHGFALASAADGGDLERLLPSFGPDLVILDVMLPGRDGFELLQVVRRTSTAAVLMLTARDSLADRIQGLTGGADDYLIKPFAMAELVARIHAVLRRSRPGGSSISIGDLVINDDATLVQRGGDSLGLTDTERRLLGYLAEHRDHVVSKTQILTAVWGYDGFARTWSRCTSPRCVASSRLVGARASSIRFGAADTCSE
jgi:DNA-binding response OmpR family regulator